MAGPTDATRAARKRARPMLLAQLAAAGTLPCPRCGKPMTIDQARVLDVGHEVDAVDGGARSTMRLEHRSCNRKAGDRRGGRGRKKTTSRVAGRPNRSAADDERRARIDKREAERRARLRRARVILPRLGPW